MRITLLLALLAVISGCAKQVRSENVNGPDGTPAIALRCGAMAHCYKAAGEFCQHGYETIDSQQVFGGNASFAGYGGGSHTRGSMLIRCK